MIMNTVSVNEKHIRFINGKDGRLLLYPDAIKALGLKAGSQDYFYQKCVSAVNKVMWKPDDRTFRREARWINEKGFKELCKNVVHKNPEAMNIHEAFMNVLKEDFEPEPQKLETTAVLTPTAGTVKTFSFEDYPVRVLDVQDSLLFVGKEVALALGYADPKAALRDHVEQEDKLVIQRGQITSFEVPNRGLTVITEPGLYELIFNSKLPAAKRFKRWVVSDVLPSLRKTGQYSMRPQTANLSDDQMNQLVERLSTGVESKIAEQVIQSLTRLISAEKESVKMNNQEFYLSSLKKKKDNVKVSEICRDYGLSVRDFNKLLESMGIQRRADKHWEISDRLAKKNYSKMIQGRNSSGEYNFMVWTPKGCEFIYRSLRQEGMLPVVER